MFWTNWNEQRPSIMRSTLAGKNMRIIISTDILTPNGLTVDHKAEKLYFSDGTLGKIERCDYDGSSRYVSVKRRLFLLSLSKRVFIIFSVIVRGMNTVLITVPRFCIVPLLNSHESNNVFVKESQ